MPLQTQAQLSDFDLLVRAIQAQYIDDKALGADWQAAIGTYRNRVAKGVGDAQFFDALDGLLGVLHDDTLVFARPVTQVQASATGIVATSTVTGSFSGVGVAVSLPEPNKNRLLILKVYAGSPAESAGLQPHDAIIKVDGQPVTYEERDSVLSRVRGPSGTQVTLTIHTPGKGDRDVKVTRLPINATDQTEARRIPNTNIGYIQPDISAPDTVRLDVAQNLRDLSSSQTLDGLVLDLRTVQSADFPLSDMLALFVNGQVGTGYTRSGKGKIVVTGRNIAGSQELPLVVMVSDQTRGTAESFAGILQDMGRARIVGNQTPGQAAIFLPLTLPDTGAQLQIPAGEYRGVKDVSFIHTGIKPDIASDQTWESFTDQDDPQLKQATQALTR